MTYNSREALESAGILNGSMSPALEELFAGLSQEEAETLISVKQRAETVMADVTAHSEEWTKPEASQQGFDATTLCACGAWSGAGKAEE